MIDTSKHLKNNCKNIHVHLKGDLHVQRDQFVTKGHEYLVNCQVLAEVLSQTLLCS